MLIMSVSAMGDWRNKDVIRIGNQESKDYMAEKVVEGKHIIDLKRTVNMYRLQIAKLIKDNEELYKNNAFLWKVVTSNQDKPKTKYEYDNGINITVTDISTKKTKLVIMIDGSPLTVIVDRKNFIKEKENE